MSNPKIRVSGLRKSFGSLNVLHQIDLEVNSGEVVVVLGPSGSGKTTLLRSLNLLEKPDGGSLEVCGHRVEVGVGGKLDSESKRQIKLLRRKTAMVFQSFNLFPHMTALQNVAEGLISIKKIAKAEAYARARTLLAKVGLESKEQSYPAKLSGGQKQRVAIARGLAMEPEVIFFDEPTSALDPELRDEVLSVMRSLASSGMTMLVVTHELRFAREAADRIVFMEHGVVVADEPPESFFNSPNERIQKFLCRY
ncbi:amino acid ABC transporter ATP-binding protein [Pseudomonas sp. S60]|uniref:amino acid ABC transporter ATP-binding protein n=1 Tax=Pseudomonas TaxID=286 RepID=UPI000E3CF316|nr:MULTISPECIES: amino acid ABC transporter ATP-binding protein [Pseudomonas]MBK5012432.1 amino acid ABC transporter ATP-binding protein [Pseudomonas sp. S60]